MEPYGAKVVGEYLAVWNKNLLMVADENSVIKFNGVVSHQLTIITDVQMSGGDLMVFGHITGIPDVVFGGQRIDAATWTAGILLGR